MKAYKVTRTMTQEFISFGNNKEEAIDNSYNYDHMSLSFLNTESMAQGDVVGGSSKAQLINDVVILDAVRDYGYIKNQLNDLVKSGANILLRDGEGNLNKAELTDE
jgi:vacuolar-type H+-ATPase catalytic subunit A/Vma1